MDEFDKLAMSVASEILRSEAASPGSQDANLVKLAEAVEQPRRYTGARRRYGERNPLNGT